MGFATNPQVEYGSGVLLHKLMSQLLVGCSEHLYHLNFVKFSRMDVLFIPSDWEYRVTDFLVHEQH